MTENIFMCECGAVTVADTEEVWCVPCKTRMDCIGYVEHAVP
jgi:hypothetical protein